jgi:hypothetical protein
MRNQTEKSWLAHLADDRRYAAMAGLGFCSGLPFLLVYSTQLFVEKGRPNKFELIGDCELAEEADCLDRHNRLDPPLLASMSAPAPMTDSGCGASIKEATSPIPKCFGPRGRR